MSNLLIAPGTVSRFKRRGAHKDDPLQVPSSSALQNTARAGGGNTCSIQHDSTLPGLVVCCQKSQGNSQTPSPWSYISSSATTGLRWIFLLSFVSHSGKLMPYLQVVVAEFCIASTSSTTGSASGPDGEKICQQGHVVLAVTSPSMPRLT